MNDAALARAAAVLHEIEPDMKALATKPIREGAETWSQRIELGGTCDCAPDEPSVNYTGWIELATIEFGGKKFDARDFPDAFVEALQEQLLRGGR